MSGPGLLVERRTLQMEPDGWIGGLLQVNEIRNGSFSFLRVILILSMLILLILVFVASCIARYIIVMLLLLLPSMMFWCWYWFCFFSQIYCVQVRIFTLPLRDFMPYFFGRSLIGTHNAGDRKEVRTKKISIRHTDLIQGEDKRFLDDFLKPVLSSLNVRYDYSIKYLTSFEYNNASKVWGWLAAIPWTSCEWNGAHSHEEGSSKQGNDLFV